MPLLTTQAGGGTTHTSFYSVVSHSAPVEPRVLVFWRFALANYMNPTLFAVHNRFKKSRAVIPWLWRRPVHMADSCCLNTNVAPKCGVLIFEHLDTAVLGLVAYSCRLLRFIGSRICTRDGR